MAPLVVWAFQAPTLLNLYAKTTTWRVEVADLGDSGGASIAENRLLKAPLYQSGSPKLVFVCSPRQCVTARQQFPGSRLIWVLHNGQQDRLPPKHLGVKEVVALSNHVASMHRGHSDGTLYVHVLVPAYDANPRYEWASGRVWTTTSRPKHRRPDRMRITREIEAASGINVTVYGQDQPAGFLTPTAKEGLFRGCTAYMSCLPDWAGFGLAEHECFAAGVPVIGNVRWGDMAEEMLDYEGFGISIKDQAEMLKRVNESPDFATKLSERGIEFVERCRTRARMDHDIEAILDHHP